MTVKSEPMYAREREMYSPVMAWFKRTLKGRYPRAVVETYDTSTVGLNRFLESQGLHHLFPQYQSYEISVDVTAVVRRSKSGLLGFVECKLNQISVRDLSQLLGYSRVAIPAYSIIVSPAGVTQAVHYLLNTFGRLDVLEYGGGHRVKVATWDSVREEISLPTLIPPGEHS
jgi:type VI protein secretion system component VasK